jgi:hypothetical protein
MSWTDEKSSSMKPNLNLKVETGQAETISGPEGIITGVETGEDPVVDPDAVAEDIVKAIPGPLYILWI